jgi:hypothetical protein
LRFEGAVNYGAASTKQEQLLSVLAAFYKSFLTIFLMLTLLASLSVTRGHGAKITQGGMMNSAHTSALS